MLKLTKQIPFLLCLAVLVGYGFRCGDSPFAKLVNFQPNRAPEIISILSEPSGSDSLQPNEVYTVLVEAKDPDGQEIQFAYVSELASFTGQEDNKNASTVRARLSDALVGGDLVNINVTVTDPKGAKTSQTLNLGSGKTGPSLTQSEAIVEGVATDGILAITFSADSDGFYQIQVLDDPNADCILDTESSFFIYEANTEETISIYGSGNTGFPKTFGSGQSDKVCIFVRDNLGQDGFLEFVIKDDEDPPVTSYSPTETNHGLTQTFTLDCSDGATGVGCDKIAYTVSDSGEPADPQFSSAGEITTGSEYTGGITVGDGTTWIKFKARDLVGNEEALQDVTYVVELGLPGITINTYDDELNNDTNGPGLDTTLINWQTDSILNLDYEIRLGATNCLSGSLYDSGTTNGTDAINTSVDSLDLAHGNNSIFICVETAAMNFASESVNIDRRDEGPLYAAAPDWNDYVSAANDTIACDTANDTGGYGSCIHGGESRYVFVAGRNVCDDLTATDALGAYQWRCDDSTDPVRMISTRLKSDKKLADLIHFDTATWYSNSITVEHDGSNEFNTTTSTWYSNLIVTNSPAVDTAGTIYLFRGPTPTNLSISVDSVAVVIEPGLTVNGTSSTTCPSYSPCVIGATGREYLWVEGNIDAPGYQSGVALQDVKHSVFRHLGIAGMDNGLARGINLGGSTSPGTSDNRFEYLRVAEIDRNGTGGVICEIGEFNTFSQTLINNVHAEDPGDGGLLLESNCRNNTFINTVINSLEERGVIADGSFNHFLNLTVAYTGSQTVDAHFLNQGSYNLLMNLASNTGSGPGLKGDGAGFGMSVLNIAAAGLTQEAINLDAIGSFYFFTGSLRTGTVLGPTPCHSSGSDDGLTNTCSPTNASDIVNEDFVDMSTMFVGSVDDTSNQSPHSNGFLAYASITDWLTFDNFYRGWADDTPAMNDVLCENDCQIWDLRLDAGATELLDRIAILNDGDDKSNTIVAYYDDSTVACSAIAGATTADDVCDYPGYDAGACTGAGGNWGTGVCHTRILRHAYEVLYDGIGNENGLCESGEECIHTPNFGAYQGHGSLESIAPSFNNGTWLDNIILYQYDSNGVP